ncbi:MAG TPA: hypothetical protein VGL94_02610 [Ktedonobacteraceae bacterium]|jgi:hypothetical protein
MEDMRTKGYIDPDRGLRLYVVNPYNNNSVEAMDLQPSKEGTRPICIQTTLGEEHFVALVSQGAQRDFIEKKKEVKDPKFFY